MDSHIERLSPLEHIVGALGSSRGGFPRQPRNLGPALHQAVIGHRLVRALLALAQGVEAVAEFTRGLGLALRSSSALPTRSWWVIATLSFPSSNFPPPNLRCAERVPQTRPGR